MKSAAVERLESLLQARKFGPTLTSAEAAPRLPAVSTGVSALDRRLHGGWPKGHISELAGARSTGRTSVMVSTLVASTAPGAVAALIDAADRFDPVSAASRGLDVSRLLWVRGPAVTIEQARPPVIEDVVERAIRAFDLVIRAGGFAVAILDVADVPSRYLRLLPQATWLRLAHANEGRDTAGLLVSDAPLGRSARGVSITLDRHPMWEGASVQQRRFRGFALGA